MKSPFLITATYLFLQVSNSRAAVAPDKDSRCGDWASAGECNANPGYMLINCATSCQSVGADRHEDCPQWAKRGECESNPAFMEANCPASCRTEKDAKELEKINSFFDLSAKDIDGNVVPFSDFQGKVTILTNVASYCGYTESHYEQLVELWSQFENTDNVEILAFPCNQFGKQEPGSAQEIKDFAKEKGVKFRMMQKIDVNGPTADLVYKFLKREAGPETINWNFGTYYVVSPAGEVNSYSGVQPMSLHSIALSLLKEEL